MAELASPTEPRHPILRYLPAVLERLDSSRVVYEYPNLCYCENGSWIELPTVRLRSILLDTLVEIVAALPEAERHAARRHIANKSLRDPLTAPFRLAIARRPQVEWSKGGIIAYIDSAKARRVFDIDAGIHRPLQPTDYFRGLWGLPAHRPLHDAARTAMENWLALIPEGRFWMDAIAHAMIGRPVERFYVLQGEYTRELMNTIYNAVGYIYYYEITHYQLRSISYPFPHRWSMDPLARARIGIMEEIENEDLRIIRDLTDGSRRISYPLRNGETVTHTQHATIFCTMNHHAIYDCTLLSRMVYLEMKDITTSILAWGRAHGPDIVAYLFERIIHLQGVPPPLPSTIEENTLRMRKSWKPITVEEWIRSAIVPMEGGHLTKSAIYPIYLEACGEEPRIEVVKKDHMLHLVEEYLGPAQKVKRVMGYPGWAFAS